jgi:hypothetical protein
MRQVHESQIVLEVYCQIIITDLRNLLNDCSKKIDELIKLTEEMKK